MSYWHILDSRHLARPTDWEMVFGRKAPLIMEIGFGRANHLIHLGKLYPEANLIGIEISQPSLRKASKKVKSNQLAHVRVLDGSAPVILQANVVEAALDELHINFPDPWYKEGHHQRRLINPRFLALAASRVKAGGLLFVATDHPSYQPVVTDCLVNSPHFDSRLATTYTLDPGERFQTKYEQKALREGRVPFYYLFQRNTVAVANANQLAIPKELEMPHAIINSPQTLQAIKTTFAPFHAVEQSAEINIHFKGVYEAAERPMLLVETYISQQPQNQRIGLVIVERPNNEYLIKLHDMGFPRSTSGAHFAVRQLANWLTSQHEDARIVTHTLQRFS